MANNMMYPVPVQQPNNGYSQNPYGNSYGMGQQPVNGYSQNPYQQPSGNSYAARQAVGSIIVDGEYEARATRLPDNWPPDTPFVMWDAHENIQYVKSIDSRGVPYPMRTLEYHDRPQQHQTSGDFVTKDDFNRMRDEMMSAIHSLAQNNGKSSQNGQRARNE